MSDDDGERRTETVTNPDKPVLGLKLPLGLFGIIDQAKARRSTATEDRTEAKRDDSLLGDLVGLCELFGELGFGDVGSSWVEDLEYELAALEEAIGEEFTGSDRYWC